MTARGPTIGELLALHDEDYRFYTAIHKIGHAASGLAIGNGAVDRCVLTITPQARTDVYIDTTLRVSLATVPGS